MSTGFERLQSTLRKLPGIGFRSSERIALHLLLAKPEQLKELVDSLNQASVSVRRCVRCGNLAEQELCSICSDERRDQRSACVVESVPDLIAIERSGSWRGVYHVLHGKLSPLHGVGPDDLNIASLRARIDADEIDELVFALPNDVEGEATCHYLKDQIPSNVALQVSRIGFGIPSGSGVVYADSVTVKSALDSRKLFH
jgi:recombination protein RecR